MAKVDNPFRAGMRTIMAIASCMLLTVFAGRALAEPETYEGIKDAPGVMAAVTKFPDGKAVYEANCAGCHEAGLARAPARSILSHYTPQAIRKALTTGSMRAQGASLSDKQKVEVAQYITGQPFGAVVAAVEPPVCKPDEAWFDVAQTPAWTNWGIDKGGAHYVPAERAGLDADAARTLEPRWAFGFPNANRARSQPALGGGAIFVGSHDGTVFALDRESGCVRWQYEGSAEVRTGIVLSDWSEGDANPGPMLYFGDWSGNVYALDARTGKEVWQTRADDHPAAVITGTPSLHGGMLYVPVSSLEEASAAAPDYECCSFRGSVVAYDAASGEEKWRTWMVGEPQQTGTNEAGARMLGPSGVAVWTAPLVDPDRGQLYVTTGDNYTNPTNELSDAIVALDLMTGAIRWHYQAMEGDAWNVSCVTPGAENCPEDAGPDFDFGAAPLLAKGSDGRDYVLAGQKSGIAYAVDPDTGALRWQHRAGRGGMVGGVHFGMAASGGRLFIPISDLPDGQPSDYPHSPGIYAVDIATGKRLWDAPAPDVCGDTPGCVRGYGASIMATDDLVIAGSDDGRLRILDAADGSLVNEIDTAREFAAVGGGVAKGGAISGSAGAVLDSGQLIVSSGYGFVSKMPGNLLLVLEAD